MYSTNALQKTGFWKTTRPLWAATEALQAKLNTEILIIIPHIRSGSSQSEDYKEA